MASRLTLSDRLSVTAILLSCALTYTSFVIEPVFVRYIAVLFWIATGCWIIFTIRQHRKSQVFDIKVMTALKAIPNVSCVMWIKDKDTEGSFMVPTHLNMFVRLINTSDLPITVESIKVEVKSSPGKWEKLKIAMVGGRDVYLAPNDLRSALSIKIEEFDSQLSKGPVVPRQPVAGWLLFHYPRADFKYDGGYRFTIVDSDARVSVTDAVSPSGAEASDLRQLQNASFQVGEKDVDLTVFRIMWPWPFDKPV